jgi:hypothetical protein
MFGPRQFCQLNIDGGPDGPTEFSILHMGPSLNYGVYVVELGGTTYC